MTLDEYIEQRTSELLEEYRLACERDDMFLAARRMEACNEINRIRVYVRPDREAIGPSEVK